MNLDETMLTTCCLLTATGRSAVAVVLIQGPEAIAAVWATFQPANAHRFKEGQIRYGVWRSTGESVVVSPTRAGEVEVHCHGGVAAARQVLADLRAAGCVERRSDFVNSHSAVIHPMVAEAMVVASRCQTARTAAIAMDQVRGALVKWFDTGAKDPSPDQLLRWADWTMRLDQPMDVVLIGPPNVGKSSIINAIVGYDRAITMDMPGTTRDVLQAETVIDGLPMRFYDTAGVRDADESIEREGVRRAELAAGSADLVIVVRDQRQSLPTNPAWKRVLRVCNKTDLGVGPEPDEIATAATTRQGIETLQQRIVQTFIADVPPPNAPVILTPHQRQRVTEQQRHESINPTPPHRPTQVP